MVGRIALSRLSEVKDRLKRALNQLIAAQTSSMTVVNLPGFKYDDFDRAGYVNFAKVNRMCEMNRLHGHGMGTTYDIRGLFSNMLGRHWTFSRELYDRASIDFPMILRSWPSAVGRSTIDICQSLEMKETGTTLVSGVFRLVNIDPVTQKSAPLPTQLAEKLATTQMTGDKFPMLKQPSKIPDPTFSCRIQVRSDDMDFLFHTTQGAYLGFARECATQALGAKFYSRVVDDDIAFHLARSTSGIHFEESYAGDELEVVTWEDASNALLLHFIVRKEGRTIYYATVEYYDS